MILGVSPTGLACIPMSWPCLVRVSFRKLTKGGGGGGVATGGIWIWGGGVMVNVVTMFYKRHLGGWGMLGRVCAGFHAGFEFWRVGALTRS